MHCCKKENVPVRLTKIVTWEREFRPIEMLCFFTVKLFYFFYINGNI
jgi:hypothetical protein